MARQLDERTSRTFKRKDGRSRRRDLLNTSIDKIIGGDEVEGIRIEMEMIPCDSVLYSIGVIPNIDIVKNTSDRYKSWNCCE